MVTRLVIQAIGTGSMHDPNRPVVAFAAKGCNSVFDDPGRCYRVTYDGKAPAHLEGVDGVTLVEGEFAKPRRQAQRPTPADD